MNTTINWNTVESLAKKNIGALVFNSELSFNLQIETAAKQIYDNKNIRLVLVAGPSASGKTTFSSLLAERLVFKGMNVHGISLDDFFYNREDIELLPSGVKDFDSPKALDMKTLRAVIYGILHGEAVEIPQFDFSIGCRKSETKIMYIGKGDIVIIEGIHALNPLLFENFEVDGHVYRISIAPRREFELSGDIKIIPDDLRLLRRLIRDYYTRGHGLEATVRQWKEVIAAEKRYVLPYLDSADSLVDSVYDYELIIYKRCFFDKLASQDIKGLEVLKAALNEVAELPIPSIPSSSLINEFVFFG